ncbi:type IV secretion system protein [uncultured Cetobacterium sp.]|uniref:type IV secretion system protein n=1 Tax=uncultured Cetobacterium sp. TaxID=527638 RepID=UPI002632FE60|nr:type IV secretion system protein [uncultured Cetobacterium sp.]
MFSWKNNNKNKVSTTIELTEHDRYFILSKANNNKKKVIFILLLLQFFSLFIIGTIAIKTNIRTYIVEKDHNNYTIYGYANDLSKKVYKPDEQTKIYFLENFIKKTRFLPSDLVLFKKNSIEANAFVIPSVATKIEQYLVKNDYGEKIKNQNTVDIDIISTLKLTKNTYQIRWIEKIYDTTGKIKEKNLMVGVLTVQIDRPKNEEQIKYNPLGIYITDISQSIEEKKQIK